MANRFWLSFSLPSTCSVTLCAVCAEEPEGYVTGEQGMLRLFPGLIRIPDVAFASASMGALSSTSPLDRLSRSHARR